VETQVYVRRADEKFFSFLEYQYTYSGGVHGYYCMLGNTFRTDTGEKVALHDLMTDDVLLRSVLKEKLEARIGTELQYCAIAMPAGTEDSVKTHQYIAEGAGLEVTNILDEPSAANAIYQIEDGVVVDIGGGTTGLAILKNGKVVQIEDEPTGGTHLSLVLSGNYKISFAEAEEIKQNYKRHKEIFPVVKPVIEKMASIVNRYVKKDEVDTLYLCGGTCCLTGIEKVFEKETGIKTIKPVNPFLVTPTGIAMNCRLDGTVL
jgi:ethanolamine utilization protein EutJ